MTRHEGYNMKYIHIFISLFIGIQAQDYPIIDGSFTSRHLSSLRNETRDLFNHGWNSYMKYAYPADEISPLSCKPYGASNEVHDINRNDVLGNYSVTFLDTITTFAVMEDVENFTRNIEILRDTLDFEQDLVVQVFETSIRALGSLLSAHLFAIDKFKIPSYDGFLLEKAKDLGERLLKSYMVTANDLPVARINLKNGVDGIPHSLLKETCTSGATTPMLEMTLLSVLTNDTRFEYYSRKTFDFIWMSRSELNLLPMTISTKNPKWLDSITGVGASIDSFYEYALKGSIIFQDDFLSSVWEKSVRSLKIFSKYDSFFANVDVSNGMIASQWIDALGAFFPGLLVLDGDLVTALQVYEPYLKLWDMYGGIPERWDFLKREYFGRNANHEIHDPISLEWYPLRPEFIESTYYLYQATRDPIFLRTGERILHDYKTNFKTKCGFAGYRDVRTKELQDRMESFVLSESFMYLYLLFDEDNFINYDENMIFSTEGHPLWIPKGVLQKYNYHKTLNRPEIFSDTSLIDHNMQAGNSNCFLGSLLRGLKKEILKLIDQLRVDQTLQNIGKSRLRESSKIIDYDIKNWPQCPECKINDSMFSKVLSDTTFYRLNSKYRDEWGEAVGSIETEANFYSIYAAPDLKCIREANTVITDYIFGTAKQVVNKQDFKVHYLDGHKIIMLENLEGLRTRLELLSNGKTDRFNVDIDQKYLDEFQSGIKYSKEGFCKMSDEFKAKSLFRVEAINAEAVGQNDVIMVMQCGDEQERSRDEYLMLDGIVVINMKCMMNKAAE